MLIDVTMTHCQVDSGYSAGGIDNASGALTLIDSRVISNSATKNGGGLYFTIPNTATLLNSIVAYSPAGDNCYGSTYPAPLTIASDDFNISSDNTCTLFGTSDKPNTDPQLAPLADYGGPTLKHLPRLGSLAIDNAQCFLSVPTDQRGVARLQGLACDIGSVERQASDKGYLVVYAIHCQMRHDLFFKVMVKSRLVQ